MGVMTGTLTTPGPLPEPLDDSQSGTPVRLPGSARRTTSIDMVWPDGLEAPLHLVGRARDLLTTEGGEAVVLAEAAMHTTIGEGRKVASIEAVPERPGIEGLVGAQAGSYLRSAIDEVLPGEREAATPLYLLLDDIAGTSLIAGFVWTRQPEHLEMMRRQNPRTSEFGVRKGRVICSGLRPGGTAQLSITTGEGPGHALRRAGELVTDDDTLAWHEFPERPPVVMRRHRRVDVARDGGELVIDAFFRDSSWEPDGTQMALHEYTVAARVDEASGTLTAVSARPHVLPFPECQWAPPHVDLLLGLPVETFRTSVQSTLTEIQSCTHLNDMLRCLAEVPSLAAALPTA
jgi:Protein of unknown function (DUF2889)